MRKVEHHDAFHFLQKFENGMPYSIVFPPDNPIRRFQSISLSVRGQLREFEKNWMSLTVITKVKQLGSLTCSDKVGLVSLFNGISTFMSYLMPKPVLVEEQ